MTSTTYKGFLILARPYQLCESKRWAAELEIRRRGRKRPFRLAERYGTEQDADSRCIGLGRQIIDGGVPGWSVDGLRGRGNPWSNLIRTITGVSMRQLIIAGIVVAAIGAIVLLRGANFTSRRDVLKVGDIKVTADQQQSIPPWVGGVVVVVGVGMIAAGTRKRA